MATPAALRRDLGTLSRLAIGDLDVIWREVSAAALARDALNDILPALVSTYGSAAATVASDWYDDLRDSAEAPGRFRAIPAEIAKTGTQELVGWASATATDFSTFQTLISGGLQRRIVNFSRVTLLGSTDQDPQASGWIRVGVGECDWCTQYLDGEVRTVEGYDFPAHDWCRCDVMPVFD